MSSNESVVIVPRVASAGIFFSAGLRPKIKARGRGHQSNDGLPSCYRGELPRGATSGLVATGERQARRIVAALIEKGVLTSASSRAPLRPAFPAALAPRWMPGLFPEKAAPRS
jgi:hypothetical protein